MQQEKKVSPLERLIKRVRRNKVTLFIGSGFSIKAGAPSVTDLISKLIEDGDLIYDKEPWELQLRDVASDFVANEGRHELMKVLVKHFSFTPTDTSDQKLLVSIPHFKTIFSTNYDSLIEDAYPKEQRVVITSSTGSANDDCALVKIYKVHGDLTTMSDPNSIIITNEDYEGFFKNRNLKTLWEDLKYAFRHTYIVFIGYSLADENIFQLVKEVREDLMDNVKGMYLISPSIPAAQQEKLKANGISYIQTTGESFLKEVKKSIDNTIVKDFEKAKLDDSRVFSEYLHKQGLNPTVRCERDKNIIENVQGYNGALVTSDFKITVANDIVEAINKHLYNVSQNIPGTKFSLPAYKIDASSLISGELRHNGVLFANKDDWRNLFVMPSNELKEITLKVPSADFIEKTQVLAYNNGENSVGYKIDIKIGEICVILNYKDGIPVGKVNMEIQLYDNYDSSSEALRWVEVPLALFSGKYVNFQFFGIEEVPKDSRPLREYGRIKRYYQTIKKLELEHNIQFKEYGNYSQDGLMCALILDSYLSKHGISYPLVKTFKCELDTDKGDRDVQKLLKEKEPLVMAVTYVNFSANLNGYEFHIPYVNICMMHCVPSEYQHIKGSIYKLRLVDQAEDNLIYGSDTPVEQIGNKLHLQS